MRFERLAAEHFRLFERLELEPASGINLILGANAAGKTTVLEALYIVGRGRGFRGTPAELAAPSGSWTVHARIQRNESPGQRIGVAWSRDGLRIRINEADATLQELVAAVPVQVLEPDSHRLLEDGPEHRRKFLDWGVFHVEHRFFPAWRSYQRALRQRNQALKSGAERASVEAWNDELARTGEEVQAYRSEQVRLLRGPLTHEVERLLGETEWSLELSSGWATGRPLAEVLVANYEHDRRQRVTLAGPHRAELKLRLSGRSAKHNASRGQQKMLIAALLLAQARLIESATGNAPVLLVDDFPAELGPEFQAALLRTLQNYSGQCFLTSIERTAALESIPNNAVFHVEHGSISVPSLV